MKKETPECQTCNGAGNNPQIDRKRGCKTIFVVCKDCRGSGKKGS